MSTGRTNDFTEVDGADNSSWHVHFMDVANKQSGYDAMRESLVAGLGELAGARVLDVGCGTGDDVRSLARLVGDGGHVTGIDLSSTMLAEANRRTAGTSLPVTFESGDMTRLPFPDASFDAVHVKLVRFHCPDLDAADDEIVRVTRPGGRIAIFDYDFEAITVDHPDRETTRTIMHRYVDGFQHGWNGRQLLRRFTGRGLTDITITPVTARFSWEFFQAAVDGQIREAQRAGTLALTEPELTDWWAPLHDAVANDLFFATLTGFTLAATR